MKFYLTLLLLFLMCHHIRANDRRPLVKPNLTLCRTRPEHLRFGSHRYALSWLIQDSGNLKLDWLTARNFCRERCMDTVAIETFAEWKLLVGAIKKMGSNIDKLTQPSEDDVEVDSFSIWTSGRLCDFEGCQDTSYIKPININGWFWSSVNERLSPTNCVNGNENCFHAWSDTGKFGFAQPDNRELREEGFDGNESCLSVMINPYGDGIKWHDRACYHKTHFICEDSDRLLEYVKRKFKNRTVPE